jgi:hypothetical protein
MTSETIALQTLVWTKWAAIGQLAGALATAAAVFISLWIVLSERRQKVRLTVGSRTIFGPGDQRRDVVIMSVTNQGFRAANIRSFGWRTGWVAKGPAWARYRTAIQSADVVPESRNPPFMLEPGETASMMIRREGMILPNPAWDDILELRRVPLIGPRLPPIKAFATTTRGTHQASIERSLHKFLEQSRQARRAQQ